jgi:hypothetical protein
MKKIDYLNIPTLLSLEVKHLLYMLPRLFGWLAAPDELFVALLEFKFLSRFEVSFFELLLVLGYNDFGKGPYHNFQVCYAQNACRQNHLTPHPL